MGRGEGEEKNQELQPAASLSNLLKSANIYLRTHRHTEISCFSSSNVIHTLLPAFLAFSVYQASDL